jgi:hypothetical protein
LIDRRPSPASSLSQFREIRRLDGGCLALIERTLFAFMAEAVGRATANAPL